MPTVSVFLPPELVDAVRARAHQTDRSVSAEVRLALREHLNVESPAGTQGSRHDQGAGNALRDEG